MKIFGFLFKKYKKSDIKENFKEFTEKECKEIKELSAGKESFSEFCSDSNSIFIQKNCWKALYSSVFRNYDILFCLLDFACYISDGSRS